MSMLHSRIAHHARRHAMALCVCMIVASALVGAPALAGSFVAGTIRFGVPPWPGVTVKSEIAARILESIGYETKQVNVGTAFVFQGLASKDIDVFLGNWSPNQDSMVAKYLEQGTVKSLADNINNAAWGIGVPGYVWDAGVRSVTDLDKYRARFKGKIYGIEKGSPMNGLINKAIDQDVAGLGDWTLITSSTAGMLLAVKRAVSKDEWIAWGAWSPHWMMPAFHTKILANSTGTLLGNGVVVRTLAAAGLRQADPNAWRFFKQMHVSAATQSAWIYDYDRKKQPLEKVTGKWIKSHRDVVSKWLKGVQARNGRPAEEVFLKHY